LPATAGARTPEVIVTGLLGDGLVWRGHSCPGKSARKNTACEDYDLPSLSARNKAAVFSSGKASARIAGFTPIFSKAACSASLSYRVFRLFQRVLRFCPKQSFRNAMNSSSETRSAFSPGFIVMPPPPQYTFGRLQNP